MCPFIETIRIEDGKIYNINYHTERCNRTRAAFWQDVADIDLGEFISPQSLEGIWKCRIVYGKAIEEITYVPYQRRKVSSLRLVTSDTIDYTYKSAHREELNALYAQRETADDILVVRNGYLTDTSISNIALYDGNTWFTPSCPLLKGTKRAELLDKHLIQEKEILHTQLGSYFRIMLFNAMIDWGQIIALLYWAGFIFCLMTTLLSFRKMFVLIRSGRKLQQGRYTLILVPSCVSPFSWGRYIFLSENDYRNHPNEILMHEKMHLRYNHSVDLIYMKRFFFCNGLILPYGY